MEVTENNVVAEQSQTQRYEVLQELGDCYTSVDRYEEAQRCYE